MQDSSSASLACTRGLLTRGLSSRLVMHSTRVLMFVDDTRSACSALLAHQQNETRLTSRADRSFRPHPPHHTPTQTHKVTKLLRAAQQRCNRQATVSTDEGLAVHHHNHILHGFRSVIMGCRREGKHRNNNVTRAAHPDAEAEPRRHVLHNALGHLSQRRCHSRFVALPQQPQQPGRLQFTAHRLRVCQFACQSWDTQHWSRHPYELLIGERDASQKRAWRQPHKTPAK